MKRPVVAAVLALGASVVAALAMVATTDTKLGFVGIVVAYLAFAATGLVLAVRRSDNPIGWIFLVMALSAEIGLFAETARPFVPPELVERGPVAAARVLAISGWFLTFGLVPVLLVLFPSGRPATPRWRLVVIGAAVVVPLGLITSSDEAGRSLLTVVLGDRIGDAAGAVAEEIQGWASIALLVLSLAGAASLVRRAMSASRDERQQLKWVGYAGALLALTNLGGTLAFFSPLRALDPDAPFPAAMFGGLPFITSLVAVPIAVGIAVLRYRLYDIDVVINRTLVYGALTAALAAAYIATITVFQFALAPFTSGNSLAIAVSTLAVIALFQPLRRRIQLAVDRRFYRRRYDAARTLDAFAVRLRDEVDLDDVRRHLIEAVGETVQPASVGVWLRGRAS